MGLTEQIGESVLVEPLDSLLEFSGAPFAAFADMVEKQAWEEQESFPSSFDSESILGRGYVGVYQILSSLCCDPNVRSPNDGGYCLGGEDGSAEFGCWVDGVES